MNLPRRRWIIVVTALLVSGAGYSGSAGTEPARPNIVLLVADDVGYGDFGCFGSEIDTPNIDRLSREGLTLTHFYVQAACVPTRFSLLTGLYPNPRHSEPKQRNPLIRLSARTPALAESLRAIGYRTVCSGKWHLGGSPNDRGFEEFYGLLAGASNYFNPALRDPPHEGGALRPWGHNRQRITEFPKGFYATDAISDHAMQQIRRFAGGPDPFFLHVAYTAAHSPLHAKPVDIAKYRGKYAAGWDEVMRRRRERQIELGIADPRWPVAPRDRSPFLMQPTVRPWNEEPLKEWNENLMTVYAAMVDCMDQGIGRILGALEETGIDRKTIVIFLSDNGGSSEQAGGDNPANIAGPAEHYVHCGTGWAYVQNTPFRGYKLTVYEGGVSTPLIVRWPGVTPVGRRTEQPGHVVDLFPTIMEMARPSAPAVQGGGRMAPHGRSLVPTLRDGEPMEERTLSWAYDGAPCHPPGSIQTHHETCRRRGRSISRASDPRSSDSLSTRAVASTRGIAGAV